MFIVSKCVCVVDSKCVCVVDPDLDGFPQLMVTIHHTISCCVLLEETYVPRRSGWGKDDEDECTAFWSQG
jgi:hypothetical protein